MARINRIGSLTGVNIKKQVDFLTPITPDVALRCKPLNIEQKPTLIKDDACIGTNIDTDYMVGGYTVQGSLEFDGLHANELFLLQGVFPDESAVTDPTKTYIVIAYNGTNAYTRLSLVATDLIAEKSTNGSSWTPDTAFCTTGTMSLVDANYNTVLEVVAAINSYTGYDCVMFGTGTEASSSIPAFAVTNLNTATTNVPLILQSSIAASTTAKTHNLTLGTTNNLPAFTIRAKQDLGTNQSINFEGCKFSNFSMTLEPQGLLKTTFAVTGKNETTGQTDLSLAVSKTKPMTVSNARMIFIDNAGNIVQSSEVKSLSITVNPKLHDSKSIQTMYIEEPDYQNYEIKLAFSVANNSVNFQLRSKWQASTKIRCYVYIGGIEEVDTTNDIVYSIFYEFPEVILSNYSSAVSTRDKLFITGAGEVLTSVIVKTVDGELTTY
jgi:hypothetical protein